MTTHAPPSFCRDSGCTCPEWEADELALGPDQQRALMRQECDTCEHALGFHLSKFVYDAQEVRDRKARGEESLEHCKMVNGGEECACALYEQGQGNDCAVCGHKKGWHKAKLVPLDEPATAPSVPAVATIPPQPPAQSWTPFPPTTQSFSSTHTHALHPIATKQDLPTNNPILPMSPPVSVLSRQSTSPTFPRSHAAVPRKASMPPTSPLPPIPAVGPSSRPVSQASQDAEGAPMRRASSVVSEASSGRGRAADIERFQTFVAEVEAGNVASGQLSPADLVRAAAVIQADLATTSSITPSLLGFSNRHSIDDTASLAPTTHSAYTGYESAPGSVNGDHPHLHVRAQSPAPSAFAFARTAAVSPSLATGPRTASLGQTMALPSLSASQLSSYSSASTSSSRGTTSTGNTSPAPGYHPTYDAAYAAAMANRSPLGPAPEERVVDQLGRMKIEERQQNDFEARVNASMGSSAVPTRHSSAHDSVKTASVSDSPSLSPTRLHRSGTLASTVSHASSLTLNRDPAVYETNKKTIKLTMSPQLEGKVPPGTVFSCRVDLGEGVSFADLAKLQIQVIGYSHFEGEPYDRHTFLQLIHPIFEESAVGGKAGVATLAKGVTQLDTSLGAAFAFEFQWTLPLEQNCLCRNKGLPLPPSLGTPYLKVGYDFSIVSNRKGGKLIKGATDKFVRSFVVDGPVVDTTGAGPENVNGNAMSYSHSGEWQTCDLDKFFEVKNSKLNVHSSQLAWQIQPVRRLGKVYIPYKITLSFGVPGVPVFESDDLFTRIHKEFSVYLARTIAVRKAGPPPGRDSSRPTLRTQFSDSREPARLGRDEFGRATWSFEGTIETPFWDARTTTTCGATIRYVLHAKCPAKVGLGGEIHMVARHLVLDLAKEEPVPALPTSPQVGHEFGLTVAGLGDVGRKHSFPSTVSIHSTSAETPQVQLPTPASPFPTRSPSLPSNPPTLAALPHLPSLLSTTTPLSPTISASSLGTDTESLADTALGRRTLGSFPAPPQNTEPDSPVDFMDMIYSRQAQDSFEHARERHAAGLGAEGEELLVPGLAGHHTLVQEAAAGMPGAFVEGGAKMEVSRSGGGLGRLFGK